MSRPAPCWSCIVGLHLECPADLAAESECCCAEQDIDYDEGVQREPQAVGRPMLDPHEITDIRSTGRKRAAMLAPIFSGMVCEWAGLKYAGGGPFPIVGCAGNTMAEVKSNAQLPVGISSRGERHHGPWKSVLENSVGVNLHRICSYCHVRWHSRNDRGYAKERPGSTDRYEPLVPYYLHDPRTTASAEELQASEDWWTTRTEQRAEYPIELPDTSLLVLPTGSSEATL